MGRRALRATIPSVAEPWNAAAFAELQARQLTKFFLLVGEDACRELAAGRVPSSVAVQCAHLLSFLDADAGRGEPR
jgi:hypothetical protein